MEYMRDMRELKIRAYIISCHNLSAIDSYSDLKSTLAGYSAECSANPYLELQVGEGKNIAGLVRYIDDSKKAFAANLNPSMKTMHPMDLILPEDNTLDIRVKSKGKLVNLLIGHTTIDLEDRYYGDAYIKALISTVIYKDYYKKKMADEENSAEKRSLDHIKRLKKKCDEISRLKVRIDTFEQMRKIEFRQLMKEGKLQSQGNIEMWLDIFPAESRYPEYNLNANLQNKYELRLIIWSIYNVPKIEGVLFVNKPIEKRVGRVCFGNIREQRLESGSDHQDHCYALRQRRRPLCLQLPHEVPVRTAWRASSQDSHLRFQHARCQRRYRQCLPTP
eukprot:TRINITY_DN9574_c0_g3_i2.p1 TRINITY_DN9574_c0_g3~~TRINITY_DN9574_c0_g3_i2.p1  ORF type:complete len:333 (+),score=70.99 TRINITY_DN9574_c0_g3_i2:974-1972(+)